MKLIIDIPEEVKKVFDNATKEDIYGCFYDHNSVIGNAIKNGTPLEAELEKIQHEIGNEFVDLQDGSEEWRSYVNEAVLSCYEIVEKRINELKGE